MQRRDFLKSSGAIVLGFTFGPPASAKVEALSPNAWLRIDPSGNVTVLIEKAELGQGAWTALAMILAEELEADWAKIRLEQAPTISGVYEQTLTGGSSSVRKSWTSLRQAGAQAREMLIAAATATWKVNRASCRAEAGAVIHSPTGRRLEYGELVERACTIAVLNPEAIPLKDAKQFRLIGKPLPRKELPAKVNGRAKFSIDVQVPGMLYAVIARCPTFRGKAKRWDAAAAKAVPGVRDIVPIEPLGKDIQTSGGVAVVADSTWAAIQGRNALRIEWDLGPHGGESSAGLRDLAAKHLQQPAMYCAREDGEVASALTSAAKTIEALYELPFQPHATMEPMNCTADVRTDRIEMWVGTQYASYVQKLLREFSGLPAESVIVHNEWSGGAFGRRALYDYPMEAWQISKAVAKPVKLMWTREDDMQHDFYRQLSFQKMTAAIDAQNRPIAWNHRIVATSATQMFETPEVLRDPRKLSEAEMYGATEVPYGIPNLRVEFSPLESGVRRAWWRSVSPSFTAFAVECFIDELAAAMRKDPYEFRMELLADGAKQANPAFPPDLPDMRRRLRKVLEIAAARGQWRNPLPSRWGRGIAAHFSCGTAVAHVVTVSVEQDGKVKVRNVFSAVDCGIVVNPDGAKAMIEGGINYGLTATLFGEITIVNGAAAQTNFDSYPVLRMEDAPPIEVYFVENGDAPAGLGEPALPPIAPAVANAVFAACGRRVRRLPITPERLHG
jgi:isoquinoline 1-oxidoreductase subunit beta